MTDLLPCPFCGGRAVFKDGFHTGYVMCLGCEVMGPNISEPEAIAAWNRRASPATPIGGVSLGDEGDQGASVARADMTPDGASDGLCKSEGGAS